MQNITPLIEHGPNWSYEAILQSGPEHFEAFIRSPRGTYSIGTYPTKEEAQQAIKEAQQAQWNG